GNYRLLSRRERRHALHGLMFPGAAGRGYDRNRARRRQLRHRPRGISVLFRCRFGFAALRRVLVAGAVLLPVSACGGGGGDIGTQPGGGGSGNPTGTVTISGKAQYQFPRPKAGCRGLDFDAVELRPIRQATVELLAATGNTVL